MRRHVIQRRRRGALQSVCSISTVPEPQKETKTH